jgi:hypothetical protein
MIRIIRPTNSRDQFGDGADYRDEELLEDWERSIAEEFRALDNYSLSVGDVVEVEGTQWLCESFGWKELQAPCNEIDVELVFGLY